MLRVENRVDTVSLVDSGARIHEVLLTAMVGVMPRWYITKA